MALRIPLVSILIAIGLLFPALTASLALPVFVLSIASIGMLHGGLDHITAFRHFSMQDSTSKWVLFLAGYMGIIGVYGLIWLISPLIALIIFILMSCYHFGQLDMHTIARPPWNRLLYLSRGIFLLGLMLTVQYVPVASIIQPIADTSVYLNLMESWMPYVAAFLVVQHVVLLFSITRERSASVLADTAVTGLMFAFLPPLLSFGLYFALWHSWDHLHLLNRYLRLPDWKSLILNAMPFTIMALLGIAGIIVLFRQSLTEPGTVMYVLIGISLLTMPHMLLVDSVVEHDHP